MVKICNQCKIEKSSTDFYLRGDGTGILRGICKDCHKEKSQHYAMRKPEIIRKASSAYRARHPEKAKAIAKKWQANNKAHIREHYSEYRKRTLPEHAERSAKRRAAKRKAVPCWANRFFVREIYDLANLRSEMTGFEWHVDHIVPLQNRLVCGLHCEQNLRVIPGADNVRKHNKFWPDMP